MLPCTYAQRKALDGMIWLMAKRPPSEREPFTQAMKDRVNELSKKTGWGATAVRNHIERAKLPGWEHASQGRVNTIMSGQSQVTVVGTVYNAVIAVLEDASRSGLALDTHQKDVRRVSVDDGFASGVQQLLDRFHHLSTMKALAALGAPPDLSHITVARIASGQQKSLKKKHYDFLSSALEKLKNGKL